MNVGAPVSFQFLSPQDICSVVGLLGHGLVLFLVFFFLRNLHQFTFPPTVQKGSLSSPAPRVCCLQFLKTAIPASEVMPLCGFGLHFSNNE